MKEKLAGFVVKLKENKKMAIGLGIGALAILIAIIVLVVVLVSGSGYKSTIKKFAKAINSEDAMEKFIEKNVDFRALYAAGESGGDKDEFVREYKDAKKDDYKDDDFVDQIKKSANYYVDEDISKLKVKSIGKLKAPDKEDDAPKGMKYAKENSKR